MDKKYLPSVVILYLNYFIHGIGCSLLSQQVVKEMLAAQWGVGDVMTVTAVAAALGLGRLVSLPFAGPLSDKLGRRISVLIGAASYVIFFIGIAFSLNIQVAYVAAVLGGVQTGPFLGDLSGNFRCHVGSGLPGENTDDLLRGSICDRLCSSRRCPSDGSSNSE